MRRILFIGLAFFIQSAGRSQQPGTPFQNLVQVGTTSPEASSIGKFGNVPVSYCTGVPGITVPIFEISIANTKVPISLNYHAGGIRVDETSSSVGLGWALGGIGVVSRNMMGRPDEEGQGYIGSPDAQAVINSATSYNNYLYSLENGSADSEPDIFQYNVNGLSGKFIFKSDGSIMQIPVSDNKIAYTNGNFRVTDAEGRVYLFEEKRQTYSSEVTYPIHNSSWCLTKIIDPNSIDTIYFNYEVPIDYTYERSITFTQNLGVILSTIPGEIGGDAYENLMVTSDIAPYHRIQTITYQEYYLKEIKWRAGKIVFVNVSDRLDVTGSGRRLDRVEVYAYQNGVYSLVTKTKLYQSYFISNPAGSDAEKNRRLRLDSVTNLDVLANTPGQVYKMSYNTTPIAPRESYAQDRWGFNNGHYENGNLMPTQTRLFKGAYYTFGNGNRDVDETQMRAGILSSIEYPTKGKTVFDFESHKFHTSLPTTQLIT